MLLRVEGLGWSLGLLGVEDRSPEPHPMLQCPEASKPGGGSAGSGVFLEVFRERKLV